MSALSGSEKKSGYSWILNSITLTILLGMLAFGHWSHWEFAHAEVAPETRGQKKKANDSHPTEGHPVHAPHPVHPATSANPAPLTAEMVEFRSEVAVGKSGVLTAPVRRLPLAQFLPANGVVSYDQNRVAQLSSRVPGIIWRVDKTAGEAVKKGEILAIIDSAEVGKAKAEFLTAVANVDIKEKLLTILNPLANVVSVRQVKEAEAALREARITLFNSHQALVNLGLPIRIEEVSTLPEAEIVQRIQFLGLPESVTKTLDRERTTANLIPLVVPFDGTIVHRDAAIGELVSPQHSQFTVSDVSKMWILLDVRIEDSDKLAMGQDVDFTPDGMSQSVRCKVNWVSTEVDEKTRTVQVRCEVDNPFISNAVEGTNAHRLLRAHQFGTGRIRIRQKPDALVVATRSIQYDGTQPVVFVQRSPESFEMRPVRLGISDEQFTELLDGAAQGEVVATVGSHLLKSEIYRKRLTMEVGSK